jgi:hypothetical protein
MNVEEMVIDVFENLGEPSDLDIYTNGNVDLTMKGTIRILQWLNRGYRRVLTWKRSDGRLLRFPGMEGVAYHRTVVLSGQVSGANATVAEEPYVMLANGSASSDIYEGWIIEITAGTGAGQKRRISKYNGIAKTAYVVVAWDTIPHGPSEADPSSYKMYKDFVRMCESGSAWEADNMLLDPQKTVLGISKIVDTTEGCDLAPASRIETFSRNWTETGIPTEYYRRGNDIVFDVAVEDERTYYIEYVKMPSALALLTDEPKVPEMYCDVIAMYAHWLGLKRNQEWSGSWAVKKDIDDLMATIKEQNEMSMEREDARVEVL